MKRDWHYADLHSHIIPGVDDGAATMRDSLIMLDQAYEEGIRMIVCTPHYGLSNPGLNQDKLVESFQFLQKLGKLRHPDVEFFLGNELYYKRGIIGDLYRGRARTLANSKCVLIEFANSVEFGDIQECIIECINYGYKPLIAHIERYENLVGKIDAVRSLREAGAFVQVNSKCFVLENESIRRDWAIQLLTEDLIDIVASDCHNWKTRGPIMNTAFDEIAKFVGEEKAFEIANTNVRRLLKGEQ